MRLPAVFDWRTREVVWRQIRIYLRNWYTGLLPPALEPLIYLLVFGLGLGGFVTSLTWHGEHLPYLVYIAPGLITYTAFTAPFFQGLYGAYVRMHYQKTWEGQLGTQVELTHVVAGEMLWAAILGTTYAAIVSVVLALVCLTGLLHLVLLPLCLPLAFILGCATALLGLLFTSIIPTIDHMNLPAFLFGMPVGMLSNTFFPLAPHAHWLALVVALNPVANCAEGVRAMLIDGRLDIHLLWMAVGALLVLVVLFPVVERLMRRRVLGE